MNKEKIIEENSRLIRKISTFFYGENKEDLYQAGILGLLKAMKNYDSNQSTLFSTYAYPYIYGEMYQLVNNKNIKVSEKYNKLYKLIEKTRYNLALDFERIPTNEEVASYLKIDLNIVEDAINSNAQIQSIDQENTFIDNFEKTYDNTFEKILINDSLNTLTEDEKQIILARYYNDLTQSETAKKLSMTQVKVSRYEKKSLNKMYNYLS